MLERKNIDRVFQENLKDLEIYPSKKVWNNIDKALTNRVEKSPIALWKKLSGIVAVSLILLTLGLSYFDLDESYSVKRPVSDTNKAIESQKLSTPAVLTQVAEEKEPKNEKVNTPPIVRKRGKVIYSKEAKPSVIVTNNNITSVYSNIDNKYIIE